MHMIFITNKLLKVVEKPNKNIPHTTDTQMQQLSFNYNNFFLAVNILLY